MTRPLDLQQTITQTKNLEKMQQLKQALPHEDQKKFSKELQQTTKEEMKKATRKEKAEGPVISKEKEERKRRDRRKKKTSDSEGDLKDETLYDHKERLTHMDEEGDKGTNIDLTV